MTGGKPAVPKLDKLVHEPARLAILSALSEVEEVDFNFLLAALDLSRGNLSSHMAKLAEAEYVTVDKKFLGNVPNTTYSITPVGLHAVQEYWASLDALRSAATGRGQGAVALEAGAQASS